MAAINAEDRRAIERGMMDKTHHKARIAQALADVGADLMVAQRAAVMQRYGNAVMHFIEQMPDAVRSVFCQSIECSQSTYYSRLKPVLPMVAAALADNSIDAYTRDALGGQIGYLTVPYPQPVDAPVHAAYLYVDAIAGSKRLQALDKAVGHSMATARALREFLAAVRTTQQLKDAMPEALAFVADKAKLPALVIDPSNALAALSRAGAFAQEATHA